MTQSHHLDNVLMQQSTGPKATMPTARPAAELLLALNEFNKYELFTGTGDGVQPLFADGSGTSNVTFTATQDTANSLNGKFVYFDSEQNVWKPAYAQADPNQTEHYTAQGFAVALSSTGLQVTTSGKLEIPFQLKDINNSPVAAGSYYYLCQDPSNAGFIQQNAPATGIKQIVCQVMSVTDSSTTLLLLNDLSQVAEDVIVTSGDGSKYLGDDGQYHPMLIAGLAGRTANCIDAYEVLDTKFDNIAAGRTTAQEYVFPALTADLGWPGNSNYAFATGWSATGLKADYTNDVTSWYTITSGADIQTGVYSGEEGGHVIFDLKWKFPQETYLEAITNVNNTVAANANSIWRQCTIAYSDNSIDWTETGYIVTNPNNTSGATSTISIPLETYKAWGAHRYWKLHEFTGFNGSYGDSLVFNKVVLAGEYFDVTNPESKGYIPTGDITIENNIASDFSETNYIISKQMVESNTQYAFRVRQSFNQVETLEPIWAAPNLANYLAIENSLLKLVLNNNVYLGNITYEPNKFYHFRIAYTLESGYVVSCSEDGDSWTNEIVLYDSINYLDGLTMYLGIIHVANHVATSGQIDLSNSGFEMLDNEYVVWNYPMSEITNKNVSTITVTFKGTGLTAQGRASDTSTVLSRADAIELENHTIIAQNNTDLIYDIKNGLMTKDYAEVEYERQFDDAESDTVLYAKDANRTYSYTVVYPNFLETSVLFNTVPKAHANVKTTGNIAGNIVNGIYTTSTEVGYAYLPEKFNPGSQTWEFVTNVTIKAPATAGQWIGNAERTNGGLDLGNSDTSKFKLWLGSNDSSYDIVEARLGTYTILANTNYYVKVEFTGTQYILSYSLDGQNYIPDITIDSTVPIYGGTTKTFGVDAYGTAASNGNYIIDFTKSYINIGGKRWWTGAMVSTVQNDTTIDLSSPNASFHPNKFLNRNGFDFTLSLDLTGSLKMTRKLDARNYGGAQVYPFYYAVQGVDWATFVNDGNYVQGIKLSSPINTCVTGTATGGSFYQSTIANVDGYANTTYNTTNKSGIGWMHYNFEKPIRFSSLMFLNWSDVNYVPVYFCMHVSNDMNTWYSIMPTDTAGYVENGMFRNVPIDAYANYTNRTKSIYWNQPVQMPDEHTYWKYVRFGFWGLDAYRPIVTGLWIGMLGACASMPTATVPNFAASIQTAEELIWEDTDFLNNSGSGIHGSVVRKQIGTAYQVKFLDELGWVETSPEDSVTDVTGKQLVQNMETVYSDERLQTEKAQQRLAYQTHCKQYLRGDRSYCENYASNPFINSDNYVIYQGCANVGAVANSFNLLQLGVTGYDFANGLLENAFVITFTNRARVGYFYMQNHTTVAYSPQTFKVYGSVNGGNEPGTTCYLNSGEAMPDAEWEEIPVYNIVNLYDATKPNYTYYEPTEAMNTFVDIANCSNHQVYSATAATYTGAYNVYIAPTKAYQQYKVVVQRTINNRVIGGCVIPKDVQFDPWATNMSSDGTTNRPLLVDQPFYPSSTATTLPLIKGNTEAIYSSLYSPTTVWQTYQGNNNACWTPGNDLKYVYLQQAFPYAVAMNTVDVQCDNALTYAPNQFMYFGTNNDGYATTALSNTNPLGNWHRITSLKDKVDIPTVLNTTIKENSLVFGYKEYGYNYFTALFARTLGASVYLDHIRPYGATVKAITDNTYTNPSIYTEEWKWTNVAGEKDEVRNGACYNHPELAVGQTTSLRPSYKLTTRKQYNPDAFKIIGNPTITKEGVASEFIDSYLNIPVFDLSSNNFEIALNFTYTKTGGLQNLFRCATNAYGGSFGFLVVATGTNSITLSGSFPDVNGQSILEEGKNYDLKLIVNDSSSTLLLNNEVYLRANWQKVIQTGYISIGYPAGGVDNKSYCMSYIDLKQFSITVDGKEIFSGAKPNEFYTDIEAPKDANLPDNTSVYRTTSMVGNKTVPYENRWMYKFTDLKGNIWYNNTPAVNGTDAQLGSYMYRNIIPIYNKEYATGIPLNATANVGSANGFEYFTNSVYGTGQDAWVAFQNPLYDAESYVSLNGSYTAATGLPVGDPAYCGFKSPKPICVQGYTIGSRISGLCSPAKWRFEGSNDGQNWELVDERSSRNLAYITLPAFTANTTGNYTVEDSRGNADAYTLINGVTNKYIDAWATYWFKITYNEDVKMDAYIIRADNAGSPEYPSAWKFQGLASNGNWVTLDERKGITFTLNETKRFTVQSYEGAYSSYRILFSAGLVNGSNSGELGKLGFDAYPADYTGRLDTPINPSAGTGYYFKNEKSYTHYRWIIEQNELGGQAYARLKVWGLFVLEENPFEVKPIYELSRTNSNGELLYAYSYTSGVPDEYVGNNIIVYKGVQWDEPENNVWAYEVTNNINNYWVITPGEIGTYAPESTMVYKDFDFIEEDEPALVDTWTYTGNINKKFSYTGEVLQDFTWDEEEPYNKYVYTGDIANQFKYTGKIEGWTYTGVSKPIYDVVPNFRLTLNQDDARQIEKKTIIGMAYPVTTADAPNGISLYSFTASDVSGTIVPQGTPLYSSIDSTEPAVLVDETEEYIYSTAPAQNRTSSTYLYTLNNQNPDGSNLTGLEQAYYDTDLTELVDNTKVNLTEYTYTSNRFTSHLKDFYHRITEETPAENYNFGLSFDGSGYTFKCYQNGADTDIQTFDNGTLLRSSYTGADSQIRNNVVIIMKQQDILKLNLTKSEYSWWTWNNLLDRASRKTQTEFFRLAKIHGGDGNIEDIYNMYPWRIESPKDISSEDIGAPILSLSDNLKPNEIWLEGQELPIKKFRALFRVYKYTYTPEGVMPRDGYFFVPSFVGRSIWGVEQGQFGYISGALPNITGNPGVRFRHANDSYNNQTTGALRNVGSGGGSWKGGGEGCDMLYLNASWSSPLYKDNVDYVQPTAVAVRVKTRFA